ncbi:MAG: tetratricopeptide repeat protein [Cyanobacteria bacterium SZAS TMP-1]|nr:tetratricopeptide repeat protein [Cyanobacteria bacterium SZAS TMP-1]
MDSASLPEKNSLYSGRSFSPIAADELNDYAAECLTQGLVVACESTSDFESNKVAEEPAVSSNPFIAGSTVVPDAVPEAAAPVVDFWTVPVVSRVETAPVRSQSYDELLELVARARAEASVLDLTPGPDDALSLSSLKLRPVNAGLIAPFGWAALFVVFSVSVLSQLAALSADSCKQARIYSDKGNYQKALMASSNAIRCNPFAASAYYERGRALVHMLRYNEAEDCFNRALTFNPDFAAALDARAALSLKLDKPQQTISDTYRLMALSAVGLNTYQYGNMAVAFYKTGRYDEAIKYYDKALALDADSLSLQLGRTYCLSGKQQHRQALAACDGLIKRRGAQAKVLALRGYCLERLHKLSAAARDFDLALAKEPNNPLFYNYRAALLAERNQPAAALKDYVKAADLDRDNAAAQHTAGKMLAQAGQSKDALRYYDRLAQFPAFVRSFDQNQERAALNFTAGNYQASLTDLKRAIELEPDCDLHVMAALCQAHLNMGGPARETIAEAYRLRPDSPSVILGDAQVEAILGQRLSAVDKYSKLLLVSADSKEALIGRGECYFDRQQWASAAADYKRAIALGESSAQVKNNLAVCENVLNRGARIKLDLPVQKTIDLARLNDTDLFNKGCQAYQSDDMSVAVIYFSELTRRQPTNLDSRINLAHSLEGAGDHGQAIAVFAPLSVAGRLEVKDETCYAHALAAAGLYDRSISILERLHRASPANVSYRLELTKLYSAAGQLDKAIGICRDSLAMNGSSEEMRNFNNVYESLVTEQLRKKDCSANRAVSSPAETEG